jgi:5-methylcytosine-specific restriction endonuclease McrA
MDEILARRVLVLNKLYNPIGVISARTAFIKLFTEVAEVVTVENGTYANYTFDSWAEVSELRKELEELGDLDDVVYTQRLTLVVPRVIRLLQYDKFPRSTVKLTRRNIYARDGNTCQYCGKRHQTEDLNIDHVIPKSKGGHNSWDNLVCSCFKCNSKKAGRTPREANMKLIQKPIRPKYNPVLKVHIAHKRYEAWKNFISEAYWTAEIQD